MHSGIELAFTSHQHMGCFRLLLTVLWLGMGEQGWFEFEMSVRIHHNVFISELGVLSQKCLAPDAHWILGSPLSVWPCVSEGVPGRLDLPSDGGILAALGTWAPARLTREMLNMDEVLWPGRVGPPPSYVHLVIRAGSALMLILSGLTSLLRIGAIHEIEFELVPWGLRSLGSSAGKALAHLRRLGFQLYVHDLMTGVPVEPLNASGLQDLARCEGGLLATRLTARLVQEVTWETMEEEVADHCCVPPPYRGRPYNTMWQVCCNPFYAVYKDHRCLTMFVPKFRSLNYCCSRSVLRDVHRYKQLRAVFLDRALEAAVANASRHVEVLYRREGYELAYREVVEPVLGDGPRGLGAHTAVSDTLTISRADIELFLRLRRSLFDEQGARSWDGRPLLIIGNGFGFSTLLLGQIFAGVALDVLDAAWDPGILETGLPLTRTLAERQGMDLNLVLGRSPEDLPSALRSSKYDLVFVDGDHSRKALIADFGAVQPFLSRRCVVVCHDVALGDVALGVQDILNSDDSEGLVFELYVGKNYVNDQGTGFFHRGFAEDELSYL